MFRVEAADRGLACGTCGRHVPVIDGIPRFAQLTDDEAADRTRASFGYEWTHFSDWRNSGSTNFADYFSGVDLNSLREAVVLDAGCGMGRHARQIAPYASRVLAVDFSAAIEAAARNTALCPNVLCVQADLLGLPLAPNTVDFVYSLGVLHHLEQTDAALKGLVGRLKPGGRLRVYLYWKKHGWSGRLLRVVTVARRVTTRLPFPVLRAACWLLSLCLWAAVVLPYRLLSRLGITLHQHWPIFVYSKYPFTVLYNDQFDRFSAPIEKRYDPDEVVALLRRAGLEGITVRRCFGWIGDGRKPA
jgi:SAM-dependent methyltransferase